MKSNTKNEKTYTYDCRGVVIEYIIRKQFYVGPCGLQISYEPAILNDDALSVLTITEEELTDLIIQNHKF